MRLKTSWFKGELFKQNFRQVGWISLIYFILLFFAVPLNIFMTFNQKRDYFIHYTNVFDFGISIQILTIFIIPVLMAMFVLRYLHVKDASDFIHSLPIKRHHLFSQQVGFGVVALWIPILLNSGLIFIVSQYLDVSSAFNLTDLGYWLITTLVMTTFIFSVSLIIGVLTGITIIQGFFTYIVLFLPVGFTFLLLENMDYALIGLPDNRYILDVVYRFSPFTYIVSLMVNPEQSHLDFIVYFIVTIIFCFIAQLIYRYRPVEAATQAIAFQKLKFVFIYSFTFCFTLIGGLYFAVLQQNITGILIGYLIFSIIGYYISQMIVHKTWRVFGEWKEYVIFLIGFSLLTVIVFADLTGYQNRIPDTEEVKHAYIMPDHYSFNFTKHLDEGIEGFSSDQEIDLIRGHHQELIDLSSREDAIHYYFNNVLIVYQLENGREIIREYNYPDYYKAPDAIRSLYDTTIYQRYTQELFFIDTKSVNELRFHSWGMHKDTVLTNEEHTQEFIDLLKQDLLGSSEEHFFEAQIDISTNTMDHAVASFNRGHVNATEWLENHGLLEEVIVGPNHVEAIVIASPDEFEDRYYYNEFEAQLINNEDSDIWIFTDPSDIELIFDQAYIYDDYADCSIAFYLKGDPDPFILDMNKSMLPDEIVQQLN